MDSLRVSYLCRATALRCDRPGQSNRLHQKVITAPMARLQESTAHGIFALMPPSRGYLRVGAARYRLLFRPVRYLPRQAVSRLSSRDRTCLAGEPRFAAWRVEPASVKRPPRTRFPKALRILSASQSAVGNSAPRRQGRQAARTCRKPAALLSSTPGGRRAQRCAAPRA